MNARKVARSLGWLSLGIGVAELVAPRAFTRTLGTRPRTGLVRSLFGLREIAAGTGILASRYNPSPWLWARVAGDAVDMVTLGAAFRNNPRRRNVGLALAATAGLCALDVATAQRVARAS